MHRIDQKYPAIELTILERVSGERPPKYRRRQVSISHDSITLGSVASADVQLHQSGDPFLFEIKFSEDTWWIVNPLKSSLLRVNGKLVELESKLSFRDEVELEGHKVQIFQPEITSLDCPKFTEHLKTDTELWDHLIHELSCDEIMINGRENIYIDYHGNLFRTPWRFEDTQFLEKQIYAATQKTSGWFSWRQNRTLRIHGALPPIVEEAHLTIRKGRSTSFTLDELESHHFASREQIDFLRKAIQEKKNIIISGGTSTGKTSLLQTIVGHIPAHDRILIAEEETEIDWPHPHVVSLESGRGKLRQTVVECLRMRPTRLIIAEVRGPESFEMLQAMNTGHAGSMTTVHANSPREALHRIESLALCSDIPLSTNAIRRQMAQAIQVIIQLTRDAKGFRKIDQIVQIAGMENEMILLSDPVGAERIGIKQKSNSE